MDTLTFEPAVDLRTVLVVAHPGHELRVHGWLEQTRPQVFILTDGSGSSNQSRLPSTSRVLARVGATPGALFGGLTDRQVYDAILRGDSGFFISLASTLVAVLGRRIDYVVGDAAEGYNPVHDICRLLVDAAVTRVHARDRRRVAHYDFPLVGDPATCADETRATALWLRLDDAALERKLAAARGYPELAAELEAALARSGSEAFRVECLRPVAAWDQLLTVPAGPPYYETYGEKQVAAGHYREIIRYRDHILPLASALREFATGPI